MFFQIMIVLLISLIHCYKNSQSPFFHLAKIKFISPNIIIVRFIFLLSFTTLILSSLPVLVPCFLVSNLSIQFITLSTRSTSFRISVILEHRVYFSIDGFVLFHKEDKKKKQQTNLIYCFFDELNSIFHLFLALHIVE